VTAFQASTQRPLSGAASLQVSGTHNRDRTAGIVEAVSEPVKVEGGTEYILRSDARVDRASSTRGMRQRLAWYDGENKTIGEVSVGTEARRGQRGDLSLRDRFNAPARAVSGRVRVGTPLRKREKVVFFVDDVVLEKAVAR
jgi:hypothetical protein